ncbi:zinc finger-containing ubiquitin peptidase 1 [Rhinatrema bivittatum]|uniref:zinc finger-containing ubiquitin peptidase 1 n=1 Tax=Rhinatrema bivittatum TaxID=194408 RepID=UPI001129BFEC|nr:zinc finger-containing ubiquitin peptidase 1 [Rhinatrema bivittatum]
MFTCDICGEVILLEADMKTHLVVAHIEQELSCPFCCLSGVSYDEMSLHIDTAHFEENEAKLGREMEVLSLRFRECEPTVIGKEQTAHNPSSVIESPAVCCFTYSKPPEELDHSEQRKAIWTEHRPSSPSKPCSGTMVESDREFQESNQSVSGSLHSPVCYQRKTINGQSEQSPPECPFCGQIETFCEDLEIHVSTKHADLLDTPVKGKSQQLYECPICALLCANCQILQEHVELHLEENSFIEAANVSRCSRDVELTRRLQDEEDRQRRSQEVKQEQEEFQKLQRQYGMDGSGGYKQQSLRSMERAVATGRMEPLEYHRRKASMMESLAFGIDDGQTQTSGIIEALHRYYQSDSKDVRRVWLSSPLDHYHSSLGDKGWGCGYRNFQMLLSSLLQNATYKDILQDYASIPCIPKIQSMIEDAWKEGFDPQGASHFNSRLQGSKAWIGACEIYSLLTCLKLKCRILDFHRATGPGGTHPRLFQWVWNYYCPGREEGPKVVCTLKPPIYLQHQGHSRTIVGIEERKNRSFCLLIFDPGCPAKDMQKLLKQQIDGSDLKLLRRFIGGLKHKQYQLVTVDGVLSLEEKAVHRQASRIFTAERIP